MTSRTHSESTYTSPTRRAAALAVAMGYLLTLFPAAYAAPAAGSPQLPPALPHESAGREMEVTSRAVISAESGGEVRLGRASIKIPAGALAEDTEISITRLGRVRDTGEGLDNATERGGGYRFLPAGHMRALPPNADLSRYNAYTVIKPFEVTKSVIAPYYGKIGLGIQYESVVNVQTLLKHGIIER